MSLRGKKLRGFTLIELLIVIAIIAVLASVIIASVSKSRSQGRDAKRKSDLKQLQLALTEYYDSANATNGVHKYPITGLGIWYSSESGDLSLNGPGNNGDWIPGLAPNFIDTLPKDPKGGASTNVSCAAGRKATYLYRSDDGTSYKLLSLCAPEGPLNDPTSPFYDPVRPAKAWMVCAGDTACTTW